MKKMAKYVMEKFCVLLVSAAMFFAVSSITSTCGFMLYQPDVPEDLL